MSLTLNNVTVKPFLKWYFKCIQVKMSATFNKGSFKFWSFLNEIKPTLIDGGNLFVDKCTEYLHSFKYCDVKLAGI